MSGLAAHLPSHTEIGEGDCRCYMPMRVLKVTSGRISHPPAEPADGQIKGGAHMAISDSCLAAHVT